MTNLNQRNTANNNRPSISVTANFGSIRVVADELNNSVLIWATKAEYEKIESTLKRLDIPPTQVLIEASIVEVTLNDTLKYGVTWGFKDENPGNLGAAQGGSTGLGSLTGALPTSGFAYTLSNPYGRVKAQLAALSGITNVKVISSPNLMVLDNHTATIAVGEQQPVETTSIVGVTGTTNGVSTSIQYKDTGVNLVVTPSVNAGNLVTMQIDQMLTDVATNLVGNTSQPAFMQRQISSKVAVRSGEAIVLGGLIKDSKREGKSGIPLLAHLPVVGALFGQTDNTGQRTELIVVISPRVVRTDIDIREVSDELRDRMRGLQDVRGFDASRAPAARSSAPITAPMPQ